MKWKVYQGSRYIETVDFPDDFEHASEVRRSLIEQDGYPEDIEIKPCQKQKREVS